MTRCLLIPNINLFLFFCLYAEDIPLEKLEPSSYTRFWKNGTGWKPLFNRNFYGNPIRMGGKTYGRGITGHAAFSMFYNVNGKAGIFRCIIGIEEENHPKDTWEGSSSTRFQVFADRKKVFDHLLFLGEKPFPIEIDLHGKTQLEIRGTYGTAGYHQQRPVFADPVLTANDPAALKKELQKEAAMTKELHSGKVVYPSVPAWEKIQIRKHPFSGYANAYTMRNEHLCVTVLPECGGRIVRFSEKGRENILYASLPEADRKLRPGETFGDRSGAGHFFRIEPNIGRIPADPLLKFGKYQICFPQEGVIRMTSPRIHTLYLQYEYELQLSPGKQSLTVINRIRNIAPFSQTAGIWSLTRIPNAICDTFHLSPKDVKTELSVSGAAFLNENERGLLVSGIQPGFSVSYTPAEDTEITALLKDGRKFRIAYQRDPHLPSSQLFRNKTFSEMEAHFTPRELQRGEMAEAKELWDISN